jgi:hypothetical protein
MTPADADATRQSGDVQALSHQREVLVGVRDESG